MSPTLTEISGGLNGNAAGTTFDHVLSGLTVGNYLIIASAVDNSGTSGAARTVTVTNQSGTAIDTATDLAYQQNQDPGAASAGTTLNVIIAKITATSGTVRLTYSGSVVQASKCFILTGAHSTIGSLIVGTPVGAVGTNSTNLVADTALTDASVALGNLVAAFVAVEGPASDTYTNDSDTTGGAWTAFTKSGTSNATATDNQTIYGAKKLPNAAGAQTYNPTIGTARDSAGLIFEFANALPPTASFTATPNPAVFETDEIALDGSASSAISPATITGYLWELVSGPRSGRFSAPKAATCTWFPAIFEDLFAGTDGAGWNSAKWKATVSAFGAGGTATIDTNRGKMLTGAVNSCNVLKYTDSLTGRVDTAVLCSIVWPTPVANSEYFELAVRHNFADGLNNPTIAQEMYAVTLQYASSTGSLVLDRKVAGVSRANLGSSAFSLVAGTTYWVLLTAIGSTITATAWSGAVTDQPASPTISVTDSNVTAAGIVRVNWANGADATARTAYVDNLVVTDG